MADYLLAIDQGTTSSRAILFDREGRNRAMAQREFAQHFPADGWVEHDPEAIWETVLATCREVIERSGARGDRRHRHHQPARDHAAVGQGDRRAAAQ